MKDFSHGNTVNSNDLSQSDPSRTHWQILGELQLRIGSNQDGTINQWLQNILSPLKLPGDLVIKILRSMEDATARVRDSERGEEIFRYLDLVVLVPAGGISKGKTWGFFRVERTSTDSNNANSQGHCIDYYLYLDRKPGDHKPAP